jgi:hypothetical protein
MSSAATRGLPRFTREDDHVVMRPGPAMFRQSSVLRNCV